MVVDASIVVLENAFGTWNTGKIASPRYRRQRRGMVRDRRVDPDTQRGVRPRCSSSGISSILFRQLSIVVIFSLLMSLLVAVTLVPVLVREPC
jgi:multidrug efflux pump subunit AcrB